MNLLSRILAIALFTISFPALSQSLEQCLAAVNGLGYHGGGMQVECEGNFILPSPLLVRCSRAMDENGKIADPTMQPLCSVYCEFNEYWGPWIDYPSDEVFLSHVKIISELSTKKICGQL